MNIVICDDDKILLNSFFEKLKPLVEQYNDRHFDINYYCYDAPNKLLEDSENIKFDVAFLDIEMPEVNGFALGEMLFNKNNDIFIFYTTAYPTYGIRSIEHRVYRFIVKQDYDSLSKGIRHMFNDIITFNTRYYFTFKGTAYSIPVNDISYCESKRNKMIIYTDNGQYEQVTTLKDMLSNLPYIFCRCHSGYIVNILHIKSAKANNLVLDNNTVIPLSKKYKGNLMDKFLKYLR